MIARTARAIAEAGVHVLVLDLYGTGDSDGAYHMTDWLVWRQDVQQAALWLREHHADRISLWGLRTGALLAADVAADRLLEVNRLLLWQPVLDGAVFLNQFLRLRIAGNLTQSDKAKETTRDLQVRIKAGEILEIAGYDLTPEMAETLQSLKLAHRLPPEANPCLWLELGISAPPVLPPASRRTLEAWRAKDLAVRHQVLTGPQFWALQEPEWCTGFIAPSVEFLSGAKP